MSKDSGTFEQLFRERLYRHKVNPPAHIWGGIAARRKAIANRKWLLLLLLILLLLSALLISVLNSGNDEFTPFAAGENPESAFITTTVVSEMDDVAQSATFDLDLEAHQELESKTDETFMSTFESAAVDEQRSGLNAGRENEPMESFAGESSFTESSTSVSVGGYSTPSVGEQQAFEGDQIIEDVQFNQSMETSQVGGESLSAVLDSELDAELGRGLESSESEALEELHASSEQGFLSELALLNYLSGKTSGLVEKTGAETKLDYEFNVCRVPNNPICFDSRYPLRFFAIDILAGPDFFDKLIEPKSEEYREYADMRLESESASFSFGAMARFSAVFQNGLALRTGIAVNQINEKFTWKDPDAVNRRVVNVLIDTIINAPMDTTFVFDTLSIVESGTRVREIHNRYQMIDIPLLVGAEFHSGNWTFSTSVGLMFNIAFEKSGEIFAENGETLVINNSESGNDIFRSSLGVSFNGSFGVGYRISPQYSILVEPRVKYQLKPLTLDNYVLNQNYFIFGVQAGLRYKFK